MAQTSASAGALLRPVRTGRARSRGPTAVDVRAVGVPGPVEDQHIDRASES